MSATVAFVGSVLMEAWITTPRIARAKERVVGAELTEHAGGKGATQAVQAARLGAKTILIGAIGDDARGSEIRAMLLEEAVELEGLSVSESRGTGQAFIQIAPEGKHAVLVAGGASDGLVEDDVDRVASLLGESSVVCLSTELPEEVSLRALELAQRSDATIILNAMPSTGATPKLLTGARLLVIQESEGRTLLGKAAEDCSVSGLARRLASKGPDQVVVLPTSPDDGGALLFDGEDCKSFPWPKPPQHRLGVEDAFLGALAVHLAEGGRLRDAVQWGVAAGSLAGSKKGSIPALAERETVEALVARAEKV